ncbi:unnamed protein product [Rotaria magnacalcarata]|uniref:Calponin-homology (CH) domain-containing protein n=2 Tax=Rotaria magnacalcarata TaxID=392030 RepID=A0A815RY91_9BILA|nr:unnamed protein product [Rotaria magnacalcarata]CAF1664089.1 unnamed protein product [Rotaria magnacalcarata]CAF2050934.1 unnamed protein product [Rotaria magnacalcarata]CAF2052249.1 unnamed protein product [Rotaria magnacalcarata]CAF2255693.1 unnamed protein product [Rotaria magnacalcarata]
MSDTSIDFLMHRQKHLPQYQIAAQYDILAWLDTIPLSRPVYTLELDFADGILIAEIVAYFFPEYVELEMFHVARNMSQRTKNWRLLNSDVLPKINLHAPGTVVHDITNGDNRAVELFLLHLREKIEEHLIRTGRRSRLQWETWRTFNVERHRLPYLVPTPLTPRRAAIAPGYGSISRSERLKNPRAAVLDNVLIVKDEEIEVLRQKLKTCEKIIRTKDKRIQELEEKFEKRKMKRPSP